MLKVLIIDRDDKSRESLRILLDCYESFEVVGGCASGMDAIPIIEETCPHIIFVDLDLADMTGLVLLELLPGKCTAEIVFTTVSNPHAKDTLEAFSMNYLVKPFFEHGLRKSLVKVSDKLGVASAEAA